MNNQANIFSLSLHPEFYENIRRYQPAREILSAVERYCNSSWEISVGGFWTNCAPRPYNFLAQGWKIHVSGTPSTAIELIDRIVPLVVEKRIPFKFCSDLAMVRLSTSKNFARTGAGKFITIYPDSQEQFLELMETCHQATEGMNGPYILSDRPYKESGVIFYRYGGHRLTVRVAPDGNHVPIILSPTGEEISDERFPFYRLPIGSKTRFTMTGRRAARKHQYS